MKFLLAALNAKYIHSNPALYSLRAYAEKYHPEAAAQVELAEYTINQTVEEILADLYERKPEACLLYTSPSPRDRQKSRMPSSA